MDNKKLLYSECIKIYNVDEAFIDSLEDSGLVSISTDEYNERFIEVEELADLEQFMRWYYDLNINVEGIEALYHMLDRVKAMQEELDRLQNEIRFYKSL
ncbi:MAG: chaperone modulator CbpM [Dysgonamonadaceae bacterium]